IVVHENRYYGPYNKLLYTLFSADTDFIISPDYLYIRDNTDGTADFIVSFEITLRQHPELMLEAKVPSTCRSIQRGRQQIRRR
ncbi:hypothetical protein J3R83DRAFT_3292, partial [Lanmaoa asiatica]